MPTLHDLTPLARALMLRHIFRKSPLNTAVGIALALTAVQAQAQEVQFHIPAQPLASALQELGRQANYQVLYNQEDMEGNRSSAIDGSLPLAQAVGDLLKGTNIDYRIDGNAIVFKKKTADSSAVELSNMVILSNSSGTITEDSKSYTPGTLATATRLVLTPRETPQSITVVTRQIMDDFNMDSIDEVMNATPGVSVTGVDSDRTSYNVRGFAVNNFQYDGIPSTRVATYSAGHTLTDMAIYDRVEILKGSTGLLTGTGTPGASFNLIRKKPTDEFRGHATVSAGSWDNYRTELDIGGPLTGSGNIRGRAVAAYEDGNSYLDNYEKKKTVYYGVLEFDLTPDTLLTLGGDYQDNEPTASTWGAPMIYDSNGNINKQSRSFNAGADWSSWEQYTRSVFATLEHTFANNWLGKVHLNHQINGYDAKLATASSGNPNPDTGTGVSLWTGKYVGETKTNSADLYLTGPFELFGMEHELVVGGTISRKHWDATNYTRPSTYSTSVDNYYEWDGDIAEPDWVFSRAYDEITREKGFYTTGRFSLTDNLKLILGGRVSDYRAETVSKNGVFTPYAGLVYDLTENFSAYASYTSIFSPQTLKTEQGNVLDPLEGDSYEVGIKGEFFNGRLNSNIAYFEIKQDNYAVATGNRAPDGTNAYRAEQGVIAKGYELELSGEIAPGWNLMGGYTHKVAKRDGEKVNTISPEDQFNINTSYTLPGKYNRLTVGAGARWQGKTWDEMTRPTVGTDDFTQDSYWLLNLMARYKVTSNVTASVNVNNLLDKKYVTINNNYGLYLWGEPRNITGSIRWDF
ncbi:TonB-dependent siderophore receptor [Pseudomonas lopnurensis]|uniref:TonB-dependent siderophore receptor n=1 Tax=Pseudomonas lopnurensis TaxID=1477517 RepID=UPI00187AD0F1|nr:TonB-dependent siderophore receptor [Pseudomonas lopnurensis]MBE7376783.1 TonB-dependent siderophore receptor [Pseudomonas lopnurensis]